MRTVSLRMSLLLSLVVRLWWCGSADRERRDGQGADADAEPLTATQALAQREGSEPHRHGRVERGQHGGHAEVGGVGGQEERQRARRAEGAGRAAPGEHAQTWAPLL